MNKKQFTYVLSSSLLLSLLSVNQVSAAETKNTINEVITVEDTMAQKEITLEDVLVNFSNEQHSFSSDLDEAFKDIYLTYKDGKLDFNDREENGVLKELIANNQLLYKYKTVESDLMIEVTVLDQVINLLIPITYLNDEVELISDNEELANDVLKEETVQDKGDVSEGGTSIEEQQEELTNDVPVSESDTEGLDDIETKEPEVEEQIEKRDEESTVIENDVKEEIPVKEKNSEKPEEIQDVDKALNQKEYQSKEVIEETENQVFSLKPQMKLMAKKAIPSSGIHIVQSGDSLSKIASTYGVSINNLIKWNNITNANVIQVGQKIILDPNKAEDKRNFKSPEEFINYFAPIMKRIANERGLFPSVMIAQALHESGYGNSDLSTPPYYNLFGIKGSYKGNSVSMLTWEDTGKVVHLNANFRDYGSYEEAIYDYANLLLTGTTGNTTRYSRTWTVNSANYVDAVYGLILDKTVNPVKGGYATDRNYAVKVIDVIEQYDLDKYDSNELNGWHVVNGKQRYYKNGQYFTGLKKVDQTVYLFSQDGNKQYGWHKLNGKDYYFNTENGGMLTGKRKVGNTTYLFNSSGSKEYGWHRLNGKDYYFNKSNGGMLTGKRKIGNTIYLLDENGTKQYGWHSDGKNKYYFSKSTGGMLTGLRNLDGTYYFFESGKGNAVKNKTIVINGVKWRFDKHGFGKKI